MEHRIPNVVYSEPPMSGVKRWALRAGTYILAIVVPVIFHLLDLRFGQLNVFLTTMASLAVTLVAALWWGRRQRRLRRRPKVAERA